jgi:hypothetical protein
MGESITFDMVYGYAEMPEQDLGVKIDLHDWQVPGEPAAAC